MDALVLALAPGFVIGFAVQRLLEIVDALVTPLLGDVWKKPEVKGFVFAVLAIAAGFALASATGVRVLKPLGATASDNWDLVVTAFVISAGTEGMNSILKYLGYKKDSASAQAEVSAEIASGRTALSGKTSTAPGPA